MTRYRVGVMSGDGIGPEVVPAAQGLVDAVLAQGSASFDWRPLPMGWTAIHECGDPMPAATKEALAECDAWVMGPHDSASYPESWHAARRPLPGGELRRDFELFANIRPARALEGVRSWVEGMDLVIVRENTEGFYTDRSMYLGQGELMPTQDVCLAIGVFTRRGVERVVRAAFEMAASRRQHLTVVHKANVLAHSTGMFVKVAHELSPEFPGVVVDDFHVDAMTVHLLRRPETFDVVVTENMFGDILSDLTGELVGGLGLGPAINAGDRYAMAQAVHGGAPDIAGKDIANPTAQMLSSMMLVRWLGERHDDADLIRAADVGEQAVYDTLKEGVSTRDLGGTAGTKEFSEAVLAKVAIR